MGVIALLGVVFALSGCAEKAYIDARKENCNAGKSDGGYILLRDANIQLLHNDCLEVAGAYRQQKDEAIGLGKRGKDLQETEEYGHYAGLKVDNDYIAGKVYRTILRMNNSHGVTKASEKTSKEYLGKGIEQLRERIAKPDRENPEKCYILQDGAALNVLRDELHKLQLGCIETQAEEGGDITGNYFIYDTPSLRASLYRYADFTPKQIEEALRKDYPLRAELVSKACRLYGNSYITSSFRVSSEWNIKRFCNEAQELYTKGGSYNGVQVFAPNPNHQNAKIAQNILTAMQNRDKQAEKEWLEKEKAEERQRQAKEAKERKYRESIMAPIARDCQGKFNNKEICHIFKHKLLEFHFAREGSQYEADEIFRDLKDYVTKLSPKKLKAMEQELSSKKNLTYKGESYCRWSEPFVWWGLKYQEQTDWSLKKSWARVCNFHQDVVLESPFYE